MLEKILTTNREEGVQKKRRLFLLEHFDLLLENRDAMILTKLRLIQTKVSTSIPSFSLADPFIPCRSPFQISRVSISRFSHRKTFWT